MGLGDYFDPNSQESQDANSAIAGALGGRQEPQGPMAPMAPPQNSPQSPGNPDAEGIIQSILGKNAATASTQPTPAAALNAAMSAPEFQLAQAKEAAQNSQAPNAQLADGDSPSPSVGPKAGPETDPNAPKPAQANDPSAALDMMKKLYGDKYGDDAMQTAIANRNHIQQMTNLQKAANQISSAISRTGMKPLNEDLDTRAKQGEQGIGDIIAGRKSKEEEVAGALKLQDLTDKKALQDPNSEVSKAYRNMAQKMLPDKMKNIPNFESLSAEAIKQNLPMIDIAIKSDMLAQSKRDSAANKATEADQKLLMKMKDDLAKPNAARSGAIGQAAQTVRKADAFEALATRPGSMTQQDTYELARALDGEISGGMPTAGATAHLIPKSALGSGMGLLQYITGNPQDAGVQKLVQRMADSSKREGDVARAQIQAYQLQMLPAYNKISHMPEYQQTLDAHGLSDLVKNKANPATLVHDMMAKKQAQQNVAPPPPGKIHVQDKDGAHWYLPAEAANNLPEGAKVIQ